MRVVGLMSGTSYDAIEVVAAGLAVDGDTLAVTPLGEQTLAYPPGLREEIAAVLPPNTTTIEDVCRLHTRLGQAFAQAAVRGVELAGQAADFVVSHGQTVYHDGPRGTLQLGAPAYIAERTGLPVLSDLRTADVARGGQGAPLVPLFDALLLAGGGADTGAGGGADAGTGAGARRTAAALNLGGIANITVVRPGHDVVGYDIGPANALLDAAAQKLLSRQYDVDGRAAARGRVDPDLLATLRQDPYYAEAPPKSTGKERFNAAYLTEAMTGLPPDDVLATLTELTALIVAAECDRYGVNEVIASGGGTRNPTLMARLRTHLTARLGTSDDLGIPSQAKEAYAFAVLGWFAWHGIPASLPSVTGARAPAVLGSWTPGRAAPEPTAAPRRVEVLWRFGQE